MADFLDEKRKEIQARLKELRPLVDEYHRLEAAERALSGVPGKPATAAARHDAPRGGPQQRARPAAAAARAAPAPAPRRRCELVSERPGITIPELAEAMGIKQNYLYRVMPGSRRGGQGDEVGARLAPVQRGNAQHEARARAPHRARSTELGDRLVDPLL